MPLVPEVARQTPRTSLTWEVKTLSRPSDGSIAGTSMEMFCRAEHPLSGGVYGVGGHISLSDSPLNCFNTSHTPFAPSIPSS